MSGSGSAAGNSPYTAVGLPGGVMAGNGGCVTELVTDAGGISKWNFRHENQLGSLIGMTNLAGDRVAEVDYGEYGQTYLKHICWDGAVDVANTQNVAPDITRVYAQFGVGIPLEAVNGLVRCVHPGAADHVSFGTVLDVGFDGGLNQSYMDVEDLEGRVLDAIKEIGCDLTILCNYGNVAPATEPVTSGHWDEITYDSLSDTTTFKDNSGTFPAHAIDWWVQPDAGRSTYLDIVTISASEIVVAGDATGLAHGLIQQPLPDPDIIGTFYTIVWPVGVDPATGTLAHDDPCNPASRLLFAGYYYMPPVAGTTVPPSGGSPGVYGKQPNGNFTGDYYCWNRTYDPRIGRWTTPDPAATPWSNLQDYVGNSPLGVLDNIGLSSGGTAFATACGTMSGTWDSMEGKNVPAEGLNYGIEYAIEFKPANCCCKRVSFIQLIKRERPWTVATLTDGKVTETTIWSPELEPLMYNAGWHPDQATGWSVEANSRGFWVGATYHTGCKDGSYAHLRDSPAEVWRGQEHDLWASGGIDPIRYSMQIYAVCADKWFFKDTSPGATADYLQTRFSRSSDTMDVFGMIEIQFTVNGDGTISTRSGLKNVVVE